MPTAAPGRGSECRGRRSQYPVADAPGSPYNSPMSLAAEPDWDQLARDALSRYDEVLLRAVASRLIKLRIGQPADELPEKAAATLTNPPVIDRRIRELPPACRKALAAIGLSRQPRWKVGHLITLLAAVGDAEGFAPIEALLEAGLLFPETAENAPPLSAFAEWLGRSGTLHATVFAHPAVAARARAEGLGLPDVTQADAGDEDAAIPGRSLVADGLEWPLRLAAAWQQVAAAPVRLTQANTLFKRDLTRLQADEVLSAPPSDVSVPLPDAGVLTLFWAHAAGLLDDADGELRAAPFPPAWAAGLHPTLATLLAALARVEVWDPARGYGPPDDGLSPFPTAALLALFLVAAAEPGAWVDPAAVAGWLWDHHPSWAGTLPKEQAKQQGRGWVETLMLGVAYPLRLVEAGHTSAGWRVRLSDLGRHLLAGGAEPPAAPAFPQTLLVQPNAEVLAYRQGLSPGLIGTLSRFARWKGIGPACTLELTAEQTYHGLESGLSLAEMTQTLTRHGMRPVPANVADLLRRWADKRERVTVYASATLVEFPTPADLDAALSRGIVAVRLTERIGLTADARDPEFKHLRLIGNRDYESKPTRCVTVADDGVTLTVDPAQSDLLLEAEIGKLADPLPLDGNSPRRFLLTPTSLRRAASLGFTLTELDAWFGERTGGPLPPAARMFHLAPELPPPTATTRLVVRFATAELTDGAMQWPSTRRLIADRLGPTAVVVEAADLDAFGKVLQEVGVSMERGE